MRSERRRSAKPSGLLEVKPSLRVTIGDSIAVLTTPPVASNGAEHRMPSTTASGSEPRGHQPPYSASPRRLHVLGGPADLFVRIHLPAGPFRSFLDAFGTLRPPRARSRLRVSGSRRLVPRRVRCVSQGQLAAHPEMESARPVHRAQRCADLRQGRTPGCLADGRLSGAVALDAHNDPPSRPQRSV